jgi:transcriptional regulator with XRE-family HTH domain
VLIRERKAAVRDLPCEADMPPVSKSRTSSIPRLLAALKQVFKIRGVRYKDVAEALGIAEVTVKRYMAGHGLTVDVLEELCSVVDMDLYDIVDEAQRGANLLPDTLSEAQEEGLASDIFMTVVFFLMLRGWTIEQIRSEFALPEWELNRYLTRLDALKLITLYPLGRFKLNISRTPKIKPGGPLLKFEVISKSGILDLTSNDPSIQWWHNYHKLSAASVQKIAELQRKMFRQISDIAEADRGLTRDSAAWYGVMSFIKPINLEKYRSPEVTGRDEAGVKR